MFKKKQKITFASLLFLSVGMVYSVIGYAAPSCTTGKVFSSQAEKMNLDSALSTCPSPLPDVIISIIGNCPNDVSDKADIACASFDQQVAECKAVYISAYAGQIQAACNYLATVQTISANLTANQATASASQ